MFPSIPSSWPPCISDFAVCRSLEGKFYIISNVTGNTGNKHFNSADDAFFYIDILIEEVKKYNLKQLASK